MKKKWSIVLLCVLLAIIITLSPSMLRQGISQDLFSLEQQEKAQQYRGILTMWHVVTFKTGGEMGSSFLNAAISKFENQHAYVFIELESITASEAATRIQKGEFPDIISYPLGYFPDEKLFDPISVDTSTLMPCYASCGNAHGETFALPYMSSFYTLVCNENIFLSNSVDTPQNIGISQNHFVYNLKNLQPLPEEDQTENPYYALTVEGTQQAMGAISLIFPYFISDDTSLFVSQEDYDYQLSDLPQLTTMVADGTFAKGNCAMSIMPYGQYKQILDSEKSAAASPIACIFTPYSDLVQMVSIAKTEDAKKRDMLNEWINYLISPTVQQTLEKNNMLPVIPLEEIYANDAMIFEQYTLTSMYGMVPNSFRYYHFLAQHIQTLQQVFDGNLSKEALMEQLS